MDSLNKEIEELRQNNVSIRFIGSRQELAADYNKKIIETCKRSWDNDGLRFNIAMNYGSRREITEAFQKMHQDIISGDLLAQDIDEDTISDYLYTANMPDPELIIRTSGEQRLSNFLIWQSAYSEFWFTKTLWPDFSKEEFLQAILDYQNRDRRFGKR
jgi:undecaprenyl diphosphate synthase